jgi:hypothetical protein
MSILDQYNNPDQQEQGNQFIDTIEAFAALAFIWWVFHRIRIHHHYGSGAIFLISSVAAFLVMINLDMTSDAAYLFWSLVAAAFVSLGKAIS